MFITFVIIRKRSIRINKAKRRKIEIEKKRIEEEKIAKEKLIEIVKADSIAKNAQINMSHEANPVTPKSPQLTENSHVKLKVAFDDLTIFRDGWLALADISFKFYCYL
mgnify:CR=1 FL=1